MPGLARIDHLVEMIQANHHAHSPAPASQLKHVRQIGLPQDAARFYELTDGAELHRVSEHAGLREEGGHWWKWQVLPAHRIMSIQTVGYMTKGSPLYERSRFWFAIVDVQDGNYLAVSVEPGHEGEILDCFHE